MNQLKVNCVLKVPNDNRSGLRQKTLQQHLIDSYNNQLFVDAEISVINRIFKAHRCILAFHSPIFQKAFYSNKNSSPLCIINDINPSGFDTLLKYIYSLQIPTDSNSSDLVQACIAAIKLEMTGIKDKLINDLLKALCIRESIVKKFWSLLQKSHLLKFRELEEKLLKFAERNTKKIFMNDSFSKADRDIIKLVLNLKSLSISNAEMLERIAHWKESNSDFYEQPVQDLLSCVKFEQLSPAEFYNVVSKHENLIAGKDALDILMHLIDPTVCSLPLWYYSLRENISHGNERDVLLNLNTEDLKDCRETDDLKLLGNLKHSPRRRKSNDFKSLEDFRKLEDSKSPEDCSESHFDEKSAAKPLPKCFQQMLEEELFTDVCLRDSNGVKIAAHKLILALQSSFFANMFYGSKPKSTIHSEYTADELKALLRVLYGIDLNVSSKQFYYVLRLCDISLKYDCYILRKLCYKIFATTTITPGIFWILFHQGKYLKNYELNTNTLLRYCLAQPERFFSHSSFLNVHESDLIRILESDCINMCEWDILEYVVKWIENNFKDFSTPESKREILKYIRFGALNAEQFFTFLKQHDKLLLKEDGFAILTYLFKETEENRLPDWCYSGPLRRFLYRKSTKIGTNISIPWTSKPLKVTNSFNCTYTATISNNLLECQIQCLEISWKWEVKKGYQGCYKCNMTIKDDNCRTLNFFNLKVPKDFRIIVPVFFTLDRQNPKKKFSIEVNANECHRCYFLNQKQLTFQNVVIEATSDICCVNDAIVDNYTSEQIAIPKNLIPRNQEVVPTNNVFGNQ